MSARIWSDVAVAVQSAIASTVAITGITKADPGVVSTAATPTDGEFVMILSSGMTEINARVFRVANVVLNTSFELEGEDTTNYGTFSSGTYQIITFGTSLGTVRGVTGSGGEYALIDTTTIHDKIETQIPGVASALSYTLENRWEPEDTGLAALREASDVKTQRAIRMTFSDGAISTFYGYVGCTMVPGGSAQDLVTTPVTFTASGLPTNYSS
jgi:hypothetical protein